MSGYFERLAQRSGLAPAPATPSPAIQALEISEEMAEAGQFIPAEARATTLPNDAQPGAKGKAARTSPENPTPAAEPLPQRLAEHQTVAALLRAATAETAIPHTAATGTTAAGPTETTVAMNKVSKAAAPTRQATSPEGLPAAGVKNPAQETTPRARATTAPDMQAPAAAFSPASPTSPAASRFVPPTSSKQAADERASVLETEATSPAAADFGDTFAPGATGKTMQAHKAAEGWDIRIGSISLEIVQPAAAPAAPTPAPREEPRRAVFSASRHYLRWG